LTGSGITNWQDLQSEILNRIQSRHWKPGELIPNEVDLADEFGCARATVNRALRAVADTGLLERRRKAGTRVGFIPCARRRSAFQLSDTRSKRETNLTHTR